MGVVQYPEDAYNDHIQRLRHTEFPSLSGTTYLDHAGTTLYPCSLIDAYHQDLKSNLYGNPHSESPASNLATTRVDNARLAVLKYFDADPQHFDVVFTANATAAIKLVADCFRDQSFWYGFHKDAHSSIVGVREVASLGSRCFASDEAVEKWIEGQQTSSTSRNLTLFAYPAQSNMTGYRLPLSWPARIRNSNNHSANEPQRAFVLLDAASYLTTGRLNLSHHDAAPDFVALSFYKIFGFPDLGALIVRKTAYDVLARRRYFGGGTVDQITVVDAAFHAKKTSTIHDFLEDGTLPFHNIIALEHAITIHERLFISAQFISNHTSYLARCLYLRLSALKHFNDAAVVQLHKDPHATYGDANTQGPILAFSLRSSNGTFVGKSHFERLAIDCGFQLRTGGVCNPGGIASMLELNHWELRRNFSEGARCGGEIDIVGGKPTGIVRISLGAMSTMEDVTRFAEFVEWFFVEKKPSTLLPCKPLCHYADTLPLAGIAPVEFCPGNGLSEDKDLTAYQVWHGQWCIVEPKSGIWTPKESTQAFGNLSCDLEPKEGTLRIRHHNKPDLVISIWDRPHQDSFSNDKTYDVYADQHIADWLSQAIGTKCTLARYRGEEAEKLLEARTCVISTCNIEFAVKRDLHRHYKVHAEAFLGRYSFHKETSTDTRGPAPKRAPLSSTRRSWLKSQSTIVASESGDSSSSQSTKVEKERKTTWKRLKIKMQRIFLLCGNPQSIEEKA